MRHVARRRLLLCSVLSLSVLWPGDAIAQLKIGGRKLNTGKLLEAGKDVAKAVTLSDKDIADLSREAVEWMDANNPIADETTEYGARLKRLTEGITEINGLPLNFKVYHVVDVNAFACGDGSIRVFSALMDLMDDDELMAIIGHEIGHVVHADVKHAMKNAYLSSAASRRGQHAGQAERLAARRGRDGIHRRPVLAEAGIRSRRIRIRILRKERFQPLRHGQFAEQAGRAFQGSEVLDGTENVLFAS